MGENRAAPSPPPPPAEAAAALAPAAVPAPADVGAEADADADGAGTAAGAGAATAAEARPAPAPPPDAADGAATPAPPPPPHPAPPPLPLPPPHRSRDMRRASASMSSPSSPLRSPSLPLPLPYMRSWSRGDRYSMDRADAVRLVVPVVALGPRAVALLALAGTAQKHTHPHTNAHSRGKGHARHPSVRNGAASEVLLTHKRRRKQAVANTPRPRRRRRGGQPGGLRRPGKCRRHDPPAFPATPAAGAPRQGALATWRPHARGGRGARVAGKGPREVTAAVPVPVRAVHRGVERRRADHALPPPRVGPRTHAATGALRHTLR
jgi:hypothetical protein